MRFAQRLKQLEARTSLLDSIPKLITIQYVDSNKEVTDTRVIELDHRVQSPSNRPWRRST